MIITNKWHMPRVEAIFKKIFSLPNNPQNKLHPQYRVEFMSVENVLPPEVLKLREKREEKSLQTFLQKTAPRLKSLSDAHDFIFSDHNAYSVNRLTEQFKAEIIDPNVLKTY